MNYSKKIETKNEACMNAVKKIKSKESPTKIKRNFLVENLNRLLDGQGISECELARRVNIPQQTLHKIFSGKTADPRISTLKALADYFSVPVGDVCLEDMPAHSEKVPRGKAIPVISWSDCIDINFVINMPTADWDKWTIVESKFSTKTYALSSKPALENKFPKGTLFIIDPAVTPSDGDLVVVQYPETGEATLRELSIDGPNQILIALNQQAQQEVLNKKIKILGAVVQSKFSYKN